MMSQNLPNQNEPAHIQVSATAGDVKKLAVPPFPGPCSAWFDASDLACQPASTGAVSHILIRRSIRSSEMRRTIFFFQLGERDRVEVTAQVGVDHLGMTPVRPARERP